MSANFLLFIILNSIVEISISSYLIKIRNIELKFDYCLANFGWQIYNSTTIFYYVTVKSNYIEKIESLFTLEPPYWEVVFKFSISYCRDCEEETVKLSPTEPGKRGSVTWHEWVRVDNTGLIFRQYMLLHSKYNNISLSNSTGFEIIKSNYSQFCSVN